MKNINKEIKSILLSEDTNNFDRIKEFLDIDFKNTFSEIFKVLEETINNSITQEIETILSNIESLILDIDDNHDIISRCIANSINRIFGGRNLHSLSDLKNIKFRLLDLNRKLHEKKQITGELEEHQCEKDEEDSVYIDSLEKKYHVSLKIHDEVIKELDKIVIDHTGRVRVNNNFITIDREDALCLDDAISLTKNRDGSYCYDVAITDIPSIIPYNSLLYKEAMKRIETLYLCDTIADLYPKLISNNLCSLLPNQDRNVIIYRFLTDPNFFIDYDSLQIIKGLIKVNSRLTYHDVNNRVNMDYKTIEMIEKMYMLSMKLRRNNMTKEKYRKIENIIKADANYHHSIFANKSVSANIIQESMILVNNCAPKYFHENGYVYLYRNLFIPPDAYLDSEVNKLIAMYNDNININSPEYRTLVEQIKSIYFGAYYSNIPVGHMGLGYDYYSHSTSAGRRFADSFNQYLTYEQIFNGHIDDNRIYKLDEETSKLADYINMKKKENHRFESEYNRLSSKGKILRR